MVKSGIERSEKFAMKYDAYVNMLRAKKMDKIALKHFQDDLYLHVKLQEYIQGLDLPYGKLGEFSDLANKFLFKGTDVLADLERFEIPLSYFEDLLVFISNIQFLFEKCVYPKSVVKSQVSVEPMSFEQLFPEAVEKMLLEDLTFELETEHPTSCFLVQTQVCAHNVVNALAPIFPSPLAEFSVMEINPTINISVLYALNPEVFPHIDIFAENPNLYNQSPTLNISVLETGGKK